MYSIYREFEYPIPDAPELMQLAAETDVACKRSAFVFLEHCAMPKSFGWILPSVYGQISGLNLLSMLSRLFGAYH
jgi:hypothetical protein